MAPDPLTTLHDAATRGEDLVTAFATAGHGAAADRLAAGEPLTSALADLLPASLLARLAGPTPPLAVRATLLLDERARAWERRRLMAAHVAYPLSALAVVAGLALVVHLLIPPSPGYGLAASMAWSLPPLILAGLLMVTPWLPGPWPGGGWRRHLSRSDRWARAALAARWRLTEEDASRWLGIDLAPLQAVLGQPDAAAHCLTLAAWHGAVAQRRLAGTARIAAALVLLGGGGIVFGSVRIWTG